MAERTTTYSEPTVIDAAWRYRWLVTFLAIAFAGLGWLYASNTPTWTAEATLSVKDPLSTNLFADLVADTSERYVQSQSAIISSRVVAKRASELLAQLEPPIDVSPDDIEDNLSVTASDSGDLIVISYTAAGENGEIVAIATTNAVAEAYQEVGRASAASSFSAALISLDGSIANLEAAIAGDQARLQELTEGDPVRQATREQYEEARQELLALEPPPRGATAAELALYTARLGELELRIATLQAVLGEDVADIEVTQIETRLDEARDRLANLQTRRDQLAVDAAIAGSGVVFYSAAEVGEPSSVVLYVVLGFVLGAIIGIAIASILIRRRRTFSHRHAPQDLLQTRFLADVPEFGDERIRSLQPVVEEPASASAESFRFVASAISLQQRAAAGSQDAVPFQTVAVLSAGLFDGKSVVTANTALAAARAGMRVLVVDADFGSQAVTEILVGQASPRVTGMTDIAAGSVDASSAILNITRTGGEPVHLLTKGSIEVDASDFFSSPATQQMLAKAFKGFDLVLVDTPAMLRVAYATTLVGFADRGLVVVRHGSDMRAAEELHHQLDLIGTPLLGYVYNAAPLRTEMTVAIGSSAAPAPTARSETPTTGTSRTQ